jgi:molecular chaperone GrpE
MTEEEKMQEELYNQEFESTEDSNKIEIEKDEVLALKSELMDQKDKYIRLVAEFDNYKKRNIKERIDLIRNASQDMIVELLPIVDDFERAQKLSIEQQNENIFPEGMNLVYHKLIGLLKSKGLEPMESNLKDFDPSFHEAITEFPSPSNELKGKVIDTVEKGYLLNDKIVRYAKVVVAK